MPEPATIRSESQPSIGAAVPWAWSIVRPYRVRLAAIVALSALEVALGALSPWPLKAVIDYVLGAQPMPAALDVVLRSVAGSSLTVLLIIVVLAGLALQIGNELVLMAHSQMQVVMGQRITYDLRARLLSHLQSLSFAYHQRAQTADSVYRIEADAYCVSDLVLGGALPLATACLKLLVMFTILARLDPSLAALSLAVVPFLYLSMRHYSGRMVDRNERVASLESSLVARAYETLASIAVVKSFAREPHELDRFVRAGTETMRARLDLTRQEAWLSVTVSAITLGGTALVLAVGGMHVLQGRLTVGSLLVAIAYLGAVYNPLSSIAHTIATLQHSRVSARRVRDVLALAPEPFDVPGAAPAARLRGDVSFDGVCFGYEPDRPILEDITFDARPGELVAIVGLTGAGKTTLARLLLRFLEPTSGAISIDGLDAGRYDLRGLRERIALVPQEPVLFEGTIAENVRYGRLDATNDEVEAAARAAQLHEFISRLPQGYDTPVAQAGATLSGGERQRIGIARALLKNAPILMLDEPTSSLDALSEGRVFEALARLREGRTTLVIAHRLSTIRDASRILVLDGGRLVAQGTHEQLLESNALYRRMCARLSVGRSLDELDSVDALLKVP